MIRSPLLLLPALTIALASASQCPAPTAAAAQTRERLPIARFGAGGAPLTWYSGLRDSARLVVRDAPAWRATWDAIQREMSPPPPAPAVDFAREMVVVAALGTRPSGGWEIVVDSALASAAEVEVYIRRLAPGRGCFTTAAISTPVDVVRLPRRDVPVRFTERLVREDCS